MGMTSKMLNLYSKFNFDLKFCNIGRT